MESVIEEMRTAGQENVNLIISALEEIVKGLAEKTSPGEFWTSVAPPLPWKKHHHLREHIDKKWEDIKVKYKEKVHFIPKLSKLAFGTGNDDVHLVDKSRERFFNHVIESSLACFMKDKNNGECTNDEEGSENMDTHEQTIIQHRAPATSTPATFRQSKRQYNEDHAVKRWRNNADLEENLQRLTRRVERRWKSDALIFARDEEQLDTFKNEKTLDRIVISGVTIEKLSGTLDERKPIMFEAVTKILRSFMDEPPEPAYANHLNSQFRSTRRVLEVRFGNVDRALQVRKAADKIKQCRINKDFPAELNGVKIGMTLTKSTKIRIAMLKGLA